MQFQGDFEFTTLHAKDGNTPKQMAQIQRQMQQPHVIYDQDNLNPGNSSQSDRTPLVRKNTYDNNWKQAGDSFHGNALALNLDQMGEPNMTETLLGSDENERFLERMNRLKEGDELTQSNRYSFGRHDDPPNFRRRSQKKNRFFARNAKPQTK